MQQGARNIVLTSRTGADSLKRRGDFIAERILSYLQNQRGATVRLVATDAASQDSMTGLVHSINAPLGGCVLLSALLEDAMFASHSPDSFERVFPPKVDAFRALERAIDLSSLDFVVTFSSVSGMFGNPGQTNYAA